LIDTGAPRKNLQSRGRARGIQHEFKTAEEVRVYLIQRGFDIERLPAPNLQIEHK
jgi:hypothetical protein